MFGFKTFLMKKYLILLCCMTGLNLIAQNPKLIPYPSSYTIGKEKFTVNEKTGIKYADSFSKEADTFISMVKNIYGLSLKRVTEGVENIIEIENAAIFKVDPAGYDYYELNVGTSKISINSPDSKGAFYGLMSLLQLMNGQKKNEVPCCAISDAGAYSWRGMHLDVARHFFSKDFIKKYLDLLAIHKMNTFHWHLTDDQGWRIEIKKYPKLTQVGSTRKGSMVGHYSKQRFDTITHKGFYSQEDIKEIVAYAEARKINVVPEIEMPGHSVAALAAYPELSCKGGPFEVAKGWGVFEDVYCTKEETFKFMEDVLTEVCALFPSTYIHIGGDECPKNRWKECPKCQDRIKKEGLKDEAELQSYFVKRIEKFLRSKNKKLIGWDEILEGGLAPEAAVMSWRGTDGGEAAAKQDHLVVMSPGSHCYFDHYQAVPESEPVAIGGFTSVKKVYSYTPTPEFLPQEKHKFILGAQGNVWTEYINTPKDVEYMALPRMCALAEVLWSGPGKKTWEDFAGRLAHHFTFLDKLKVNYSKGIYDVYYDTKQNASLTGYEVILSADVNGTIRYTTDGKIPDSKSAEYKNPFPIDKTTNVKAALFIDGKPVGKIMSKEFIVSFASGRKVDYNRKPHENYIKNGSFSIVNGILESQSLQQKKCLAWYNDHPNITIDLGEIKTVKKVTLYVLQDGRNFIVKPKAVTVFCSTDDSKFDMLGKTKLAYYGEDFVKVEVTFDPVATRYVKLRADNPGKTTSGTVAHNEDLWIFVDEVVIE
jgi:hexosaminidase